MEKELIIRNKKFPNLICQIFNDNEFGMVGESEPIEDIKSDIAIDNENYAFEVLKLLKEAERRGCFDKIKNDERINEYNENKEEILI